MVGQSLTINSMVVILGELFYLNCYNFPVVYRQIVALISAQQHAMSQTLKLGSLCLHCCMRDTA